MTKLIGCKCFLSLKMCQLMAKYLFLYLILGGLSRPMSVPAPSSHGLYSNHPVPPSTRPHDQSNNNMAMPPNGNGHGGPSSSQMMSPSSSSHGNQQVSSTSPLVVPQPVKIRPPKTYHCRMCDQVCAPILHNKQRDHHFAHQHC